MNNLIVGTNCVSLDEKCFGLYELNFKSPDQKARHRYQIILVNRGDKIAEFRKDLGLASKYKAEQIRIPGGVIENGKIEPLHTVGELVDIADWKRGYKTFDKRELAQSERINS